MSVASFRVRSLLREALFDKKLQIDWTFMIDATQANYLRMISPPTSTYTADYVSRIRTTRLQEIRKKIISVSAGGGVVA